MSGRSAEAAAPFLWPVWRGEASRDNGSPVVAEWNFNPTVLKLEREKGSQRGSN
jgi:hypothetical protein